MTADMTLTEFLLARIAEDEAAARGAAEHRTSLASHPDLGLHLSSQGPAGERWTCRYDTVNATHEDGGRAGGIAYVGNFGMALVRHIARHDPARVLTECEAKRRIVELHDGPDGDDGPCCAPRWTEPDENRHVWFVGCWTTMTLASVYADHEDFRAEWAL